ncbi:MAG: V-type ATP synthase subunit E [Spirochaetales bacterium]|jgi:V/A-type H+-transporting ATPase subunit E|nr:V-type ATP synthase subunit E [Spirochaetales bacterium]
MDVQLKELIETIKAEGIKEADAKAQEILSSAEARSRELLEAAKGEGERIVASARSEAARLGEAGREALKQAGRDLILKLEARIKSFFDVLLQSETAQAYSTQVLENAILSLVSSFRPQDLEGKVIELSPGDFAKLESALRSRLGDQLKSGLEIKPFSGIDAGFRIGEKDGAAYYNFTHQGLAEMLSQLLNPQLSALLKEAVK